MVNNVIQRSLDWYRQRLGHITGSMVGVLMKPGRNDVFSDTAKSYLYQVAAERCMNPDIINDDELFEEYIRQVDVTTKSMRFGTEQEGNARYLYSRIIGREIEEVGSCAHPSIPYFASSPDGYIDYDFTGEKVVLEIKCPNQSTYMKYLSEVREIPCIPFSGTLVNKPDKMTDKDKIVMCANGLLLQVKPEYFYQCMAHIMCTGADYCVFITYCPFQKPPIHIVRIYPEQVVINEMEKRILLANEMINNIINRK